MNTGLSVQPHRGLTLEELLRKKEEVRMAIRRENEKFGHLWSDLCTPPPSASPLDVWVKRLRLALSAYEGIRGGVSMAQGLWRELNPQPPGEDTPSQSHPL